MTYEFRNAVYSAQDNTSIDLEINHPEFGWIPFTAKPDDVEEAGRDLFDAAVQSGSSSYIAPTADELRAQMQAITPRQLRLALIRSGIALSSITAAIAALPDGPDKDTASIEWDYATSFNRLDPILLTLATALSLNADEVDTMWALALTI